MWPISEIMATEDDENYNQTYPNSNSYGTQVYIDMHPSCVDISPMKNRIKYPQEKFKTFVGNPNIFHYTIWDISDLYCYNVI